jgi:hypothetical protein
MPIPMKPVLTLSLAAAFLAIALLHAWWAARSKLSNQNGAVPYVDGKPVFRPSRAGTWAVAVLMTGVAVGTVDLGGLLEVPFAPRWLLLLFGWSLAAVFLARAIGDFRLLGFFKRPNPSAFARLDTLYYSPLCTLLALGVGALTATA